MQIFIYRPESKAKQNKFLNSLSAETFCPSGQNSTASALSLPCPARSWSCWFTFKPKVFLFPNLKVTRSSEGSVFQGWWEKTAFNAGQLLPHSSLMAHSMPNYFKILQIQGRRFQKWGAAQGRAAPSTHRDPSPATRNLPGTHHRFKHPS